MRPSSSHDVEVLDATLRVYSWEESGAGQGEAILFAHANGFCALMWSPVIDELPLAPPTIAPDLRGHGASSSPTPTPEHYSWDRYAEDLIAVIEDSGVARVHGVGHSMGGAALALAADKAPNLFESLFLFEPIIMRHGATGSPPANPLSEQARRRRDRFDSRAGARERLGSKPPFVFWDSRVLDLYLEHAIVEADEGGVRLACQRDIEAVNYEMGSIHGGFEALGRLNIPVTLASGALSSSDGPIATRPLVQHVRESRYVEFPNRTHFGPFEDPRLFATEVGEHLDLVRSGRFAS